MIRWYSTFEHMQYIYTNKSDSFSSKTRAGFTLVELIVSVGIFSVVMLVAVGALLTIMGVNQRVQAMEQVTNSLHFTIDSMARQIRVGTTYHCGPSSLYAGEYSDPLDCPGGNTILAFEPFGGDPENDSDQIVYRHESDAIQRSIDGGTTFSNATPESVVVEELKFFGGGTDPTDTEQPYVLMIVSGYISIRNDKRVDFNLETFITQRNIDVPDEE